MLQIVCFLPEAPVSCSFLKSVKPSGHYTYRTVVIICTASLNIQQFYVLPTQLYLCVLCGSENKQGLFPYTTLTDWFV